MLIRLYGLKAEFSRDWIRKACYDDPLILGKKELMRNRDVLQFDCQSCRQPVQFSIFELDASEGLLKCAHCKKKYAFTDAVLRRQLKKFEALCRLLIDSEEILCNTSVGVDVGEHHVKIPYRLLLTRLNSTLDLMIGEQPLSISFRIEPVKDLSSILTKNE